MGKYSLKKFVMYIKKGKLDSPDFLKQLAVVKKSAELLDDAESQFLLAQYYLKKGDKARGVGWLNKCAKNGFLPKKYDLYGMYRQLLNKSNPDYLRNRKLSSLKKEVTKRLKKDLKKQLQTLSWMDKTALIAALISGDSGAIIRMMEPLCKKCGMTDLTELGNIFEHKDRTGATYLNKVSILLIRNLLEGEVISSDENPLQYALKQIKDTILPPEIKQKISHEIDKKMSLSVEDVSYLGIDVIFRNFTSADFESSIATEIRSLSEEKIVSLMTALITGDKEGMIDILAPILNKSREEMEALITFFENKKVPGQYLSSLSKYLTDTVLSRLDSQGRSRVIQNAFQRIPESVLSINEKGVIGLEIDMNSEYGIIKLSDDTDISSFENIKPYLDGNHALLLYKNAFYFANSFNETLTMIDERPATLESRQLLKDTLSSWDINQLYDLDSSIISAYVIAAEIIFPTQRIIDFAYVEPLTPLNKAHISKISFNDLKVMTKASNDISEVILITHAYLKERCVNDADKQLMNELENKYLAIDYEGCKEMLTDLCTRILPPEEAEITKQCLAQAKEVILESNHSRRFFENRLSQFELGLDLDFEAMSRVSERLINTPVSTFADVERALFSMAELSGKGLGERALELKNASPVYATKDRKVKDRFIAKEFQRNEPEKEMVASRNKGLLKSTSPNYYDELTDVNQRSRVVDVNTHSGDASKYSLTNARSAFAGSLSGHTYFMVAVLEKYMKENPDEHLNADINNFIKAFIANYISRGYHSYLEIVHVLQEDNIQQVFRAQGVTLDLTFADKVLENTFDDASDYAMMLCKRRAVQEELIDKFGTFKQSIQDINKEAPMQENPEKGPT